METFPPREFRYFRHYHIMSSFFAVFFIGFVLIAWVPFLIEAGFMGFSDGPVLRSAVYSTVVFVLLLTLWRRGKRVFDRTRFIVSIDGIARCDPYRTVSIAWRDITGVRNRRLPGAKGSLEIKAQDSRITLPSTITGFGLLCEEIRNGCMRAGKEGLFESGLMRTMSAMGTMSERWNDRARAAFWPIVTATAGTLFFNVFVALRIWHSEIISLIIWAGITLPLPLLVYSVADFRLNRRYERALLQGEESSFKDDLTEELALGFLIVAPFYGILGIIARTIFMQ